MITTKKEKSKNLFDEIRITKIWNPEMGKYGNFNLSKDQHLIRVNFLFDGIIDNILYENLNGYIWIQREEIYFELANKLLKENEVIEQVEFYKKTSEKGYTHYKLDFKTTDKIIYEEPNVKNILNNIGVLNKTNIISTLKK